MCPACKEPLVVFELDGVEIDRCLRCGGTWLDDGGHPHSDALRVTERFTRRDFGHMDIS